MRGVSRAFFAKDAAIVIPGGVCSECVAAGSNVADSGGIQYQSAEAGWVLGMPVVLSCNVFTPVAVLPWPVLLNWRALRPIAVFQIPAVLPGSAPIPYAVLLPGDAVGRGLSTP
jgi:hypothetical protein